MISFLTNLRGGLQDQILLESISIISGRKQIHEAGGSLVWIDSLLRFDSLNSDQHTQFTYFQCSKQVASVQLTIHLETTQHVTSNMLYFSRTQLITLMQISLDGDSFHAYTFLINQFNTRYIPLIIFFFFTQQLPFSKTKIYSLLSTSISTLQAFLGLSKQHSLKLSNFTCFLFINNFHTTSLPQALFHKHLYSSLYHMCKLPSTHN